MAGSASEKPKQKRDAEQTRRTLMRAALREFATHGYSGARAERIAKTARRNIRMLYHYFGSKEGIYIAVLEDAYASIRAEEAKLAIDYERPLEGLIGLLDFTFAYFAANPYFEALLRTENMMRGKYVRRSRLVPETAFPLRQTISRLIESGQAKGLFREGLDDAQIYITITALSRFHLANAWSLSALLEIDMGSREWLAERLDHCRALLRAYLLAPAPSQADEARADAPQTI
ncbi:TetR family transcriptional regulator [Sphingomonas oleivorans]|uniref:TetR family transcriptional regulator n=1 Tax=Sphingomonas oleivorans TaxID=1735121 RepID=A0A2T5FUY3_9SPHN|nr:TetR/AcrR family transcriptional regulator [Sphingomonas oleivorans]PTQ08541.1 TetR family transcriptional regulator [Sphingomonas oleivorans]